MGNKRVSRKKRRVYGSADQETRGGNKIISAFRMVEGEQSLDIAAAVQDIDFDEELLRYSKVPKTHKVFLLDPRSVNRHFKRGFEQGFNFSRALERTKNRGEESDDIIEVKLGEVVVKNHKHVFGKIESPELDIETNAMKHILGDEGMIGLRGKRADRAARHMLYLAQLAPPFLGPENEADLSNTIETAFAIHGLLDVTLESVQVSERQTR